MLSRVPVDNQGQFPVNAHLIAALGAAFLFFNQLLFWLVAVLLVRESRMDLALRFFWLAGGASIGVWAVLAGLHWKEGAARARDVVAMAIGFALLAAAFRRQPPISLEMAVANLLLILWSFRGLLRPGSAKRSGG